jgi:putative CocE/NonD family hydrolase
LAGPVRFFGLVLVLAAALPGAEKPAPRKIHAMVPMRDGVRLATQVFLPGGDPGRLPVILERTPYGKATDPSPNYSSFVERGYAVVVQDVRGRYDSEGSFDPLRQEGPDGYDTLEWIASQSWSNGKVGMIGGSYRGIVQWKAALTNNSHLKAIFPVVSGWDDYRDRFYSPGGAMKLGHRLGWMSENLKAPGYHTDFNYFVRHLPLRTSDVAATGWSSQMYRDAIAHPSYDAFWRALSVRERIAQVKVPVFAVGGWYDNYAESDLEAFAALRKASGSNRVLIGPWPHNMSYAFPEANFGPDSGAPIRSLQLAWFDRWLKGRESSAAQESPARLFVMGANAWRDHEEWPPADARPRRFFLTSAKAANSLDGDGVLFERLPARSATVSDRFIFDPRDPVPTRGGSVCCNPKLFPWGPMDQRPVERRPDVLVYTSAPLKQEVEAIGPVEVVLWVSTTAKDTDFTAKLVDVFPDGHARNLTDGIVRLRYRNSLDKPEAAVPGKVYRVSIDAGVTANVFLKGHSIRLEISSSNFPRFDRNPNTGGVIANETKLVKAAQTVYHDRERPSQVVLMVMPGRADRAVSASSDPARPRALPH